LSREEYAACGDCPYLLLSFQRITVSKRGYELLKRYQGAMVPGQDTLVVKIDLIYTSSINTLNSVEQFIDSEIQNTLEEWESEYAWLADLLQEKITPEYVDYVVGSFDYKNKIAIQHALIYQNYVNILKEYRAYAEEILQDLEVVLAEEPADVE